MLVSVFAGLVAVVLTMQLILCGLPFFRRMEYDAVCHKYVQLMDRAGGLDSRLREKLIQELSDRGFVVTHLSGTASALYGAPLDLLVVASFPFHRFGSDLILREVSLSITHQSSTVCRVFKVAAGP